MPTGTLLDLRSRAVATIMGLGQQNGFAFATFGPVGRPGRILHLLVCHCFPAPFSFGLYLLRARQTPLPLSDPQDARRNEINRVRGNHNSTGDSRIDKRGSFEPAQHHRQRALRR